MFFFSPPVTFHWPLLFCQTVFLLSVLPVTTSSPPSASLLPPSSLISPTCWDDTARAPPPLLLIISNLLCHGSCWWAGGEICRFLNIFTPGSKLSICGIFFPGIHKEISASLWAQGERIEEVRERMRWEISDGEVFNWTSESVYILNKWEYSWSPGCYRCTVEVWPLV